MASGSNLLDFSIVAAREGNTPQLTFIRQNCGSFQPAGALDGARPGSSCGTSLAIRASTFKFLSARSASEKRSRELPKVHGHCREWPFPPPFPVTIGGCVCAGYGRSWSRRCGVAWLGVPTPPRSWPSVPCASALRRLQPIEVRTLRRRMLPSREALKLEKAKRLDEAYKEFDAAARLAPNNVNYLTALAMTREQLIFRPLATGQCRPRQADAKWRPRPNFAAP